MYMLLLIYLFIDEILHWVFVVALGLSPAAEGGAYAHCTALASLQWLLVAEHRPLSAGFQCCGLRT